MTECSDERGVCRIREGGTVTRALNKLAWPAAAVYWALLATASLLPSGTGPLKGWDAALAPDVQDALHLPAYSGLVILLVLAWSTRFRTGAAAVLVITVACIAFGTAMEAAQYFIPGRTCSLMDGLVNTVGAVLGCLVVIAWRRLRSAKAQASTCVQVQRPARCDQQ
jgi:VanZ family protein